MRKHRMFRGKLPALLVMINVALLGLTLVSCVRDAGTTSSKSVPRNSTAAASKQKQTSSISVPGDQPVTYHSNPQDVIIRTFYGGGHTGALELAPQISIYGDGSYIFGINQRGKLSSGALRSLLDTLVNEDRLLTFTRQVFSDVADQNMTFLELELNGQQKELVYGSFGHYQASAEDMNEYQRLAKALATTTEMLQGPTSAYTGTRFALLARQIFNQDPAKTVPYWSLSDFTLAQAATYECGVVPADDTSPNAETACLKFIIPSHAILLTRQQAETLTTLLDGSQGTISEQGLYYQVTLRPLLPDELASNTLAMLGGNQSRYIPIALHQGDLPPVPPNTQN